MDVIDSIQCIAFNWTVLKQLCNERADIVHNYSHVKITNYVELFWNIVQNVNRYNRGEKFIKEKV